MRDARDMVYLRISAYSPEPSLLHNAIRTDFLFCWLIYTVCKTVRPVLSGHSKEDPKLCFQDL